MTETVGAFAVGVIGLVVLCFASVVLAIKTEGDRSISWSGFGVVFNFGSTRSSVVKTEMIAGHNK